MTANVSKKPSLHEVMNRMARRDAPRLVRVPLPATGEEALICVDPLLASLHKEWLDAQARWRNVAAAHGADAPMAAVAADMADSARCAYETRQIEARGNRALRRAAARLLRMAEADRKRKHAAALLRARFYMFESRRRLMQKARREAENSLNWIFFLLMMLQLALQQAQKQLSLASSFAQASADLEAKAGKAA